MFGQDVSVLVNHVVLRFVCVIVCFKVREAHTLKRVSGTCTLGEWFFEGALGRGRDRQESCAAPPCAVGLPLPWGCCSDLSLAGDGLQVEAVMVSRSPCRRGSRGQHFRNAGTIK